MCAGAADRHRAGSLASPTSDQTLPLAAVQVSVLLNNAAVFDKGTSWGGLDAWKRNFDVNVFGVLNVQQVFVKV
jgi:NAD(P)-dependent dehydrogenase (short-subunit alcohol dehydrogenase family)